MIEIQVCSKEGLPPFSKGDNYETAKIHWQSFKIFSRITGLIITYLGTKHSWVKGIQGFTNKDHSNFKYEIMGVFSLINLMI